MNCEQFETLLLDYASGRTNHPDRELESNFALHTASCAACRTRAEGFRRVSQVMDDWDTPEISPWFNARLRQRIAEEEAARWSWQRVLGWLKQPVAATAFAVVLLVGSIAFWSGNRPSAKRSDIRITTASVEELVPVSEDFDMLANFDVIQDLKDKKATPADKSRVEM